MRVMPSTELAGTSNFLAMSLRCSSSSGLSSKNTISLAGRPVLCGA
jgi:hypothetical protein